MAIWRLARSVSRSSSRGDDHGRRTWNSRNGACQRSSSGPSRSAAARLSDVADGRPRARHRADHPDHRSVRAVPESGSDAARLLLLRTRIDCATIRNAFERWRRARHWKPKRPSQQFLQTPRFEEPAGPAPEDPIAADRKRREYESLFASNVVLSRRPEGRAPGSGSTRRRLVRVRFRSDSSNPSLDEIASAVVRATGGTSAGATRPAAPTTGAASEPAGRLLPAPAADRNARLIERTRSARPVRCTRCSREPSSTRC